MKREKLFILLASIMLSFTCITSCTKNNEQIKTTGEIESLKTLLLLETDISVNQIDSCLEVASHLRTDTECYAYSDVLEFLAAYRSPVLNVVPACNLYHQHIGPGYSFVGNWTVVDNVWWPQLSELQKEQYSFEWHVNEQHTSTLPNPRYIDLSPGCTGVMTYRIRVTDNITKAVFENDVYAYQNWESFDFDPCECILINDFEACPDPSFIQNQPIIPAGSDYYQYLIDPGFDFDLDGRIGMGDLLHLLSRFCNA